MDSAQNFRLETPDSEGSNLHGPSHVTNLCFETRFAQNLQDVWISLKNLAQLIVTYPGENRPTKNHTIRKLTLPRGQWWSLESEQTTRWVKIDILFSKISR